MAIIKRDVTVDHRFPLPLGVIDVRHVGETDASLSYETDDIAEEGPILDSPEYTVPTVTGFTIVSQEIRMTSDGRSVVDVTVEFPDVERVVDVNVRLSKL